MRGGGGEREREKKIGRARWCERRQCAAPDSCRCSERRTPRRDAARRNVVSDGTPDRSSFMKNKGHSGSTYNGGLWAPMDNEQELVVAKGLHNEHRGKLHEGQEGPRRIVALHHQLDGGLCQEQLRAWRAVDAALRLELVEGGLGQRLYILWRAHLACVCVGGSAWARRGQVRGSKSGKQSACRRHASTLREDTHPPAAHSRGTRRA